MSVPTTSTFWNQTTPAVPSGDQSIVIQSDNATPQDSRTAYPKTATSSLRGVVRPDGTTITIDGEGTISAISTPSLFPSFSLIEVSLSPSVAGNFTVAHGLSVTPSGALIQMTSGGQIWFQSVSLDSANLYLVASDAGVTGMAVVFYAMASTLTIAQVALAPSAPGNFTVAHGLGITPTNAAIQMTSGGQIWFQTPTRFDLTNFYLVASDVGVTAKAIAFYAFATLTVTQIALAPSAPGSFTVAHGLGVTPMSAVIQMTSGGQVWLQAPTRFDATNIYLVASDAAITGNAVLFH